jgi:hypothetical protein
MRDTGCEQVCDLKLLLYKHLCSGDEICRAVRDYSDQEHLNHTTKHALKDFSEYMSGIQDYRESQVGIVLFSHKSERLYHLFFIILYYDYPG